MGSISEFASLSIFLISRITCTGLYTIHFKKSVLLYLHHKFDPWIQLYTSGGNLCRYNRFDKWRYSCKDSRRKHSTTNRTIQKNQASFRLLVSKIYFLRDQAIQTCKEKNWGCNETCRPTINPQTWAKIVKKEKWKVHRGDRRVKTGENNEDLLFCYEVLTQSPTG